MPFFFGRHDYLLLLYVFYYFVIPVLPQSIQNPAFGQELGVFSGSSTQSPDYSNFSVAQSQAFQTIYLFNATEQRFVKPLFDFNDGCNESTTLSDLQRWNGNGVNTLMGIQARSKIALVQRSGNCTWSTKVRTVTRLSQDLQLGVQIMLIYDNQSSTTSSPPLPDYTLSPAIGNTTVPDYPNSQIPSTFNITQMKDNDITDQLILPNQPNEIYFISNDYGRDLLTAIKSCFNTTTPNTKSAPSVYVFLVPFIAPHPWNNNLGSNSGPNYLSWVIALASLFFIAVLGLMIFFRWWRIRQQREERAYNAMLEERNLIAMRRRKLKPLPVNIVNSYPIQNYHVDAIKNTSCAICLDDFEENQPDIRILPCGHGFCVLCIDPWLTQKSTLCPICKFNCLPLELRDPEDDEEANIDSANPVETNSHGLNSDSQRSSDADAIPCEASSLTTTPSTIQIAPSPPPLLSTIPTVPVTEDDHQEQKVINEKETGTSSDQPTDEQHQEQKPPTYVEEETGSPSSSSQAPPSPMQDSHNDNNNNNNNDLEKEKDVKQP